jgi:CRP-like cAMP-binding protein
LFAAAADSHNRLMAAPGTARPSFSGKRAMNMNTPTLAEVDRLAEAVTTLNAEDAFRPGFTTEQWRAFGNYLTRHEIRSGDLLVRQGDRERTTYLLEQGSLQVYVNRDTPGNYRIAILRPGSVLGEPALFSDTARMANVEALTPCIVWALRGSRLDEMAMRSPALAIEVLKAGGAVMAARMKANMERSIPIS